MINNDNSSGWIGFLILTAFLLNGATLYAKDGSRKSVEEQIKVVLFSNDDAEFENVTEVLKQDLSVQLFKKSYEKNDISSILSALDEIQEFNRNHSLKERAHIAYLPFSLSIKQLGSNSQNQKVNALRKALQSLHNDGTTVIVPAGDQSERIKQKNNTIVPAAFDRTLTFSSLEKAQQGDSASGQPSSGNGKLKLSDFSNFGNAVNSGVLLNDQRLNRNGIQLAKSTRTAALYGVKAAATFQAQALAETGMIPSPDLVKREMKKQAVEVNQKQWINDPTGHQEPLLNVDMVFGDRKKKTDDNPTVEVTIPANPRGKTFEYKKEGSGWYFLHSNWPGSDEARTFEFTCDDPDGTIIISSLIIRSGFDGGNKRIERSFPCNGKKYTWNP